MAKSDGGPAFPTTETWDEWNEAAGSYRPRSVMRGGMKLRDYFAGQVIGGLLAEGTEGTVMWADGVRHATEWAYEYADAMIAARGK